MSEPARVFATREGEGRAGFHDPAAERRFARRLARHPWRLLLPLLPLALCAALLAFALFLAGRDAAFERALAAQHERAAALASPASAPPSAAPRDAAAGPEGAAAARALLPVESRFDPWFAASAFEAGVARLEGAWTEAHRASGRLAESAPAAAALHEDLERFRPIPARMLVAADELLEVLIEAGDPGRRLAAVGRLMAIAQRSALGAERIRQRGPELLAAVDRFGRDVVALGELVNALQNGDAALGVERVHGREARALVEELGGEFRGSTPLVREIIEHASALATHEAARADLRDALRTLRSELDAIAGTWREGAASRPPPASAAGLLLALAALALLVTLRGLRRDAAEGRRLVERHAGQAARARALGEEVEARRAHRAATAQRMQVAGTAVAGVEGGFAEMEEALAAHRETLERATVAAADGAGRARDLRARGYEMVEAVDAAAAGARAARDAAEEAGTALDTLRSGFREGAARMRHVVESGALVGAVTEDLREIGDRARMLSINVAVRASSGGPEGRALARFADDVQELADRAGRAGRRLGSLGRALHETAEEARGALERVAGSARSAAPPGGSDAGARSADAASFAGAAARAAAAQVTGDARNAAPGHEGARPGGARAAAGGEGAAPRHGEEARAGTPAAGGGGIAPPAGGGGPRAGAGEVAAALRRLRASALALAAALEVQVKYAGLLHRTVGDAGRGLDEVSGARSAGAGRAKQAVSAVAAALADIESPEAPAAAGGAGPAAAAPSAPADADRAGRLAGGG